MEKPCRNKKALVVFGSITTFSCACMLMVLGVPLGVLGNALSFCLRWILDLGQVLDPLFDDEMRKSCFVVFGLAGSVIPPVYKLEAIRKKGILIGEMIDYYFPHYKIVMLINFILSFCGQRINAKDMWVYLFAAILVTVVYAIVLVMAIGLNKWYSDRLIMRFTSNRIKVLQPDAFCSSMVDDKKIERARFLAGMCSYISAELVKVTTPHCITPIHLEEYIRQIIPLIIPQEIRLNLTEPRDFGFLEEYSSFFRGLGRESETMEDICDAVFYEIPAYNDALQAFDLQVDLAEEFWRLILNPMPNLAAQVQGTCRVFHSVVSFSGEHQEGYLILGCGLITYLYRVGHERSEFTNTTATDYCARFVDEMRNTFLADKPFTKGDDGWERSVEQLCKDHMMLIWCIAETEIYRVASLQSKHEADRILKSYLNDAGCEIVWRMMHSIHIRLYLSLALCLIRQLPSTANRSMAPAQKKRLCSYVLNQINRMGM